VAANLVVDAMLTAFVESAVDSSIEPLAQRARKILQEEGSHRVHAEAWTRRLLGRGGPERADLLAAIDDAWAQAARWPGPDDDAGYAAALELGLVAQGPAALRERVRRAVGAVLSGEPGAAARLADPTGWAGWDAARRRAS
jgi:1,2-phenylacetyl-CoA epoxidase catalytic subunit